MVVTNFRKIPLTQGQLAIVDSTDYDWLTQWRWCANWSKFTQSYYAVRNETVGYKKLRGVKMHRVILGLKYRDGKLSDHRNGDTLDNRRFNLRVATNSKNAMNSRRFRNNTSGFKGVCRDRARWRATITVNYKRINIGWFATAPEAYVARCEALKKYHGEFARVA